MTRVLSLLGASLPKQLMIPNEGNPEGFWEPQSVADLNDEMLHARDSDWDDVFAFQPRPPLSNFDHVYLAKAVELIEEEFDGADLIVLKDPRISVLTSFWDRALGEAGFATNYVIVVRNPLEVAESLRARDSFPREKSLLLWSSYMIAVERDTRGKPRTFVSYDQLMNDWRSVRSRIERDTGVQFPRATATAAVEIDRFLNLDLRHHQASLDDLLSRDDVSDDVKTLYRVFVAACEGAEIDEASLEAVQARLAEIEALMGPLLADLRSRERKLTADVATLNDAHAGARGQADALAEELAEARSKLSKLKKSLDVLDSEFEHAVRLVEQRVERRLADAETERDELLQEIRAEKERVEEREAELRKLGEEAQHFRALSARSEAKLTKFEDDLEQVEQEMENTLQAVEQRIATVESSLRDTRMERDRLAAERELLVNERDLLAGERDALAAERELLVNERDLLAGERDALAADLAAANSTLDRFRRSVSWRMTRPVRWVGRQFTRRPG
jgi:hypothetical protein